MKPQNSRAAIELACSIRIEDTTRADYRGHHSSWTGSSAPGRAEERPTRPGDSWTGSSAANRSRKRTESQRRTGRKSSPRQQTHGRGQSSYAALEVPPHDRPVMRRRPAPPGPGSGSRDRASATQPESREGERRDVSFRITSNTWVNRESTDEAQQLFSEENKRWASTKDRSRDRPREPRNLQNRRRRRTRSGSNPPTEVVVSPTPITSSTKVEKERGLGWFSQHSTKQRRTIEQRRTLK